MSEDSDAFLTRADVHGGVNKLIAGAAVLVVIVFGVLMYVVYRADRPPEGPLPVVRAPEGPLKVPPKESGGMDVPHTDKLVFDRVEGQSRPVTETLEAPAQAPSESPADDDPTWPETGPEEVEGASSQETDAEVGDEASAAAADEAARADAADADEGAPLPAGVLDVAPRAKPDAPARSGAGQKAQDENTVADDLDRSVAEALSGRYRTPFEDGLWQAQLVALTRPADVKAYWERLKQEQPALMRPLRPYMMTAKSRGRTFYRLRAGPFTTKEGAEAFCNALEADGRGCLVVPPR